MRSLAVLYKVRGPSGLYFALHDPQTGRLWTERSQQAARSQARELGLSLGAEKSVSHQELMRLVGRDPTPDANAISSRRTAGPAADGAKGTPAAASPPRPIRSSAPFVGDNHPPVMFTKSKRAGSIFASGEPVPPPAADAQAADGTGGGDVLQSKRKLPKGLSKNPFADDKKRRRQS